jgi:hypothetical protein
MFDEFPILIILVQKYSALFEILKDLLLVFLVGLEHAEK